MPRRGAAGACGSSFQLSEEPPYLSPRWLHQLTFPAAVHKACLSSASSPVLVISCLFGAGHSDRCEVVSHCGFGLHFPDDE